MQERPIDHMNNLQYHKHKQHKVHRAPAAQAHHHHPVKMALDTNENSQTKRIIYNLFCIYISLLVASFLTCAAYCLYQHLLLRQKLQQEPALAQSSSEQLSVSQQQPHQLDTLEANKMEQEFEARFVFVERLVSALTVELQETQRRLQEREKCDCSMSCTFNGTRYADRSSWQSQCDTCTCQSGRISCQPQKCPPLSCDDPVQIPGQCCPVCMKRCKYNATVLRHGQKFSPQESNKECKCQDGRIKCDQRKLAVAIRSGTALAPQTTIKGSDKQQELPSDTNKVVISVESKSKAGESQMSAAKGSILGDKRRVEGEKSGQQQPSKRSVPSGNGDELQLKSAFTLESKFTSNHRHLPAHKVNIENG